MKIVLPSRRRARGRRQLRNSTATRRSPMRTALAPFKLRWFEEPCDPLDFALLAEIAERLRRRRSPPARTCSRRRTWRTWCASAACAPSAATSSRSIRRRPTASCNMRARSTCWRATAGRAASLFPHGGNQMSLAIAAGFGLGGAESYPGVFGDFGGFADDARIENGCHHAVGPPRHRLRGPGRALPHHARTGGDLTAVPALSPKCNSGGQFE